MNARTQRDLRRAQLQLECELQRRQLGLRVDELAAQLGWIDHVLAGIRRVSPVMVAAGVALTVATRASGVIRLLGSAAPLLQTLRRAWRRR